MKPERITKKQALRAARAKLPILGDKKLQAELDMVLGHCNRCSEGLALAEAYRLGAETAQCVIAGRLAELAAPTAPEALPQQGLHNPIRSPRSRSDFGSALVRRRVEPPLTRYTVENG
jgi:hypothetical protein